VSSSPSDEYIQNHSYEDLPRLPNGMIHIDTFFSNILPPVPPPPHQGEWLQQQRQPGLPRGHTLRRDSARPGCSVADSHVCDHLIAVRWSRAGRRWWRRCDGVCWRGGSGRWAAGRGRRVAGAAGGGGGAGDVHLSSVSIRRYSVLFSTSLLENSERMNQCACIM